MKTMNNETKNINVNEVNEQELEQVNGGLNFFRTAESKVQCPIPIGPIPNAREGNTTDNGYSPRHPYGPFQP